LLTPGNAVVVKDAIISLRFDYRIMQMDFLIRSMEPVASKQNRSRKLHRIAPSMKHFLPIMSMMEMVPPVKSKETFCAGGRDQHLWRLVM